jgi:hypothetical protein
MRDRQGRLRGGGDVTTDSSTKPKGVQPAAQAGASATMTPPKIAADIKRTAEVQLELRIAGMALRAPALRLPALLAFATEAVRTPFQLDALLREVDAQEARRTTPEQDRELFRKGLLLLARLRAGSASSEGAP